MTRGEAAAALAAYQGERLGQEAAIRLAVERGWMATDHRNWFHADLPFVWADWRENQLPKPLPALAGAAPGPVTRGAFALRLAGMAARR